MWKEVTGKFDIGKRGLSKQPININSNGTFVVEDKLRQNLVFKKIEGKVRKNNAGTTTFN